MQPSFSDMDGFAIFHSQTQDLLTCWFPIRTGQEFSAFVYQLDAGIERTLAVLPELYQLPLGVSYKFVSVVARMLLHSLGFGSAETADVPPTATINFSVTPLLFFQSSCYKHFSFVLFLSPVCRALLWAQA
jgi:hypothetical protein